MMAVHWSAVKNTKTILRNGIRKSKRGVFCFPLTGIASLDRWWAQAFRDWRPRTQYNGFVFRIVQEDLPARWSHWVFEGDTKLIQSLAELQRKVRETIIWRVGEKYRDHLQEQHALSWDDTNDAIRARLSANDSTSLRSKESDIRFLYDAIGAQLIVEDPNLVNRWKNEPGWMTYVLEDYQLVLSRSIDPRRIQRVISASQKSGRQRIRKLRLDRNDHHGSIAS